MKSESRDRVELDDHLQDVLQFMQENVPAEKLVQVSVCLNRIAPLLWGQYPQQEVLAIRFIQEPILPAERTQLASTV